MIDSKKIDKEIVFNILEQIKNYPNTSFTFFSNILLHSEINRGEKQSSLIEELTSINNGSSQIQSFTIIMPNYHRKFKHNFFIKSNQ